MRARSLAALVAVILVHFSTAHADPKADVEKKIKDAMGSYDMMDYDAAKKLLNQALATAKKAKLDKDPVAARAYLDLGIVSFVNNDQDAAKLAFLSAVQIDPKIQIDPAYKSPEMAKLLDDVRGEVKGGSGGGEPDLGADLAAGGGGDTGSGDCASVKGLQHQSIDTAKAGAPQHIEALVGSDVKPVKVSVMYRSGGATNFTEVKLAKQGDCKYVGEIPASGMHGSSLQYYVAAYGSNGKPAAEMGSAGSPNIMELTGGGGAAAGGGDDEDPLGGGKASGGGASGGGGAATTGGEISSHVQPLGSSGHSKFMLALSAGSGFGFLSASNTTEGGNPVKSAGFGTSLAVFEPEIAYKPSAQMSIGLVGRIGIPIGANMDGHSPIGPAGLLRLRYALAPSGEGVEVMGQVGFGILRSTLKLDNTMSGMGDVDIVAQGPLLLGGGIGYNKKLSGSMTFLADLSALAGIAVTDKIGLAPMNSGVTVDVDIGLAFGL